MAGSLVLATVSSSTCHGAMWNLVQREVPRSGLVFPCTTSHVLIVLHVLSASFYPWDARAPYARIHMKTKTCHVYDYPALLMYYIIILSYYYIVILITHH